MRGLFFVMSFDYYQILRVNSSATRAEIKSSYRRLAKLFHPDKNPISDEKFRLIKEAYETLIDDVKRQRYDIKRNYDITTTQAKKTGPVKKQKTYMFTEPELKHRKYYQEHYKPNIKTTSYVKQKTKTTNYKELTYLLISIPVAITLVLLLVNLYQKSDRKVVATKNISPLVVSEIKTAESPYKNYFAADVFDTASLPCIKIKNSSNNDVIVFLRNDKEKIIRHYFIEHNYQLYMEGIPKGIYGLYYYAGKGFTNKQNLLKNIIGNFNEAIGTDSFPEKIKINPTKTDSFLFSIPNKEIKNVDTLLLKRIFKSSLK